VLQFSKIASSDSEPPPPLGTVLGELSSNNFSATTLKNVTNLMQDSPGNDAQGRPTAEYVTLPFLRSKTTGFLFGDESPLLFIRSQYITLYDELVTAARDPDTANKFALEGISCSGKTSFIYYFMYRLHKEGSSFRGYNCGKFSACPIPIVASDPGYLNLHTHVDWTIVDYINVSFPGDSKYYLHLYDYDHMKLVDNGIENAVSDGEYAFYTLPPLSYVDTCAVGLCPRRFVQEDHATYKDIGTSVVLTPESNGSAGFSVLHPLLVMANFVAHRSAPRELLRICNSIFYVIPEALFSGTSESSGLPGMLFLRAASSDRQAKLLESSSTPYPCYQSIFDQSVEYIEGTRSLDGQPPADEEDTTAVDEGEEVDCVAAQNALASTMEMEEDELEALLYTRDAVCSHRVLLHISRIASDLLECAFGGIMQDFCMALKTSSDNTAFQELFLTLLPVIDASVETQMQGIPSDMGGRSGKTVFRRHKRILGGNYNRQLMPQHVSVLKKSEDATPVYYYTVRSTTMSILIEKITAKIRKRRMLIDSLECY
jgi:hypothetical protein